MYEIKIIVAIENILGIYRNYTFLRQSRRILVQIRVFVESCVVVAAFVYLLTYDFAGFSLQGTELDTVTYLISLFYICFTTINTLTIFILSYVKSDYFKDFIFNINAVYEIFKNDETHKHRVKIQQRRFLLDIILYAVAMSFMTCSYTFDLFVYPPATQVIVMFIYEMFQQHRFFYENFVFFEYTKLINVPLHFLNESTSAVVDKFNDEQDEIIDDAILRKLREELEKWAEANQLLMAASDNLRQCFGIQVKITDSKIA